MLWRDGTIRQILAPTGAAYTAVSSPNRPYPMSIAKYVIGTSLAHQMRSVTNTWQNDRNQCAIRLALANVVSANVGSTAPVDWLPIGAITDLLPTSSTPAVTPQCSTCHRSFKSSSGLARHKCDRTKRRTVSERADFPFECPCQRKFRLRHHLVRHQKCCSSASSTPLL